MNKKLLIILFLVFSTFVFSSLVSAQADIGAAEVLYNLNANSVIKGENNSIIPDQPLTINISSDYYRTINTKQVQGFMFEAGTHEIWTEVYNSDGERISYTNKSKIYANNDNYLHINLNSWNFSANPPYVKFVTYDNYRDKTIIVDTITLKVVVE